MTTTDEVAMTPTVRSLTPLFGAVVDGVAGAREMSAERSLWLRSLLHQYKVLFFRNQNLTADEQEQFASAFGPPFLSNVQYDVAPDPEADKPGMSGLHLVPFFHSDYMYEDAGPAYSALQLLKVPDVGGDTLWVDLVQSYDALSSNVRDFLEPLTALHGIRGGALAATYGDVPTGNNVIGGTPSSRPVEHPLVRWIPETGRANYWIGPSHTLGIKELTTHESQRVLQMLFEHIMKPDYTLRWRWSAGDVAVWDHRTTLHRGIADFGDAKQRYGRRVSVAPNRPERRPDTGG